MLKRKTMPTSEIKKRNLLTYQEKKRVKKGNIGNKM